MPIKFKNIPPTEPSNPLQKHLNNILSPSKEKMEFAEKKLKTACAATALIKKNTDTPEKASKASDPLKTDEAKDNLIVLSAAIDKTMQVNQETEQTINEYLSNLNNLRKENQLVYGRKLREFNLSLGLGLGLGLVDMEEKAEHPFYKKPLTSTTTSIFHNEQYTQTGAVEFGVTYDNKIFIVPKSEVSVANNLYKMAQGTLLKSIGCIQIGNRQIEESVVGDDTDSVLEGQVNYISVYNAFFDAPKDNIAVSLFALQRLGIDLIDTQVVIPNDTAPLISHTSGCNITIHGEIKNAAYYLNHERFPGAKALAEKNLTFLDKLDELLCSIDDEIFSKRNKRFIEKIFGEKELLKLNLIKLFHCAEEFIKVTEKTAKITIIEPGLPKDINQPTTSFQATADQNSASKTNTIEEQTDSFNDYWQTIRASIQFFKEQNIDLSFLTPEINMVLAYILQNGLTSEERNQLQKWFIPQTIIPGRGLDRENISPYIAFYEQDPIKACMTLLKDYSKGDGWQGVFHRFFSGAWNRNYKDPVNKIISAYNKNELPDNLNICGIYKKLKDFGLIFNFDAESKSSLRKILLFCAKLNNEEEALLHLIRDASLTLFPPFPDKEDSCIKCC